MLLKPRAIIDLNALQHNFTTVRSSVPNAKIIAMVKSNAYGHGLVEVAKHLTEADAFGVARLDEGLILREAGISQPVIIMSGFLTAEQLSLININNFQPVVHSLHQVELLEQLECKYPINLWLAVETGMGRLGFDIAEVSKIFQRLSACRTVDKIRMMSHFACIDQRDHPTNQQQLKLCSQAISLLSTEWSLAKSAAVQQKIATEQAWIRPGIMLYGVSPVIDKAATDCHLTPVMTLQAPIISVKKLPKGSTVGYGSDYICEQDMLVAVVAIGYGDGYPRHACQGTPMLYKNKLLPRIGRVCMDMCMLDCRSAPDIQLGDVVTVWGKELPVEFIANQSRTIAYDCLCGIAKRVDFCFEL